MTRPAGGDSGGGSCDAATAQRLLLDLEELLLLELLLRLALLALGRLELLLLELLLLRLALLALGRLALLLLELLLLRLALLALGRLELLLLLLPPFFDAPVLLPLLLELLLPRLALARPGLLLLFALLREELPEELLRADDEPLRALLVSPASARSLFTVRAAISSARPFWPRAS